MLLLQFNATLQACLTLPVLRFVFVFAAAAAADDDFALLSFTVQICKRHTHARTHTASMHVCTRLCGLHSHYSFASLTRQTALPQSLSPSPSSSPPSSQSQLTLQAAGVTCLLLRFVLFFRLTVSYLSSSLSLSLSFLTKLKFVQPQHVFSLLLLLLRCDCCCWRRKRRATVVQQFAQCCPRTAKTEKKFIYITQHAHTENKNNNTRATNFAARTRAKCVCKGRTKLF